MILTGHQVQQACSNTTNNGKAPHSRDVFIRLNYIIADWEGPDQILASLWIEYQMNEGLVKFPWFQEDHKVTDVFTWMSDLECP